MSLDLVVDDQLSTSVIENDVELVNDEYELIIVAEWVVLHDRYMIEMYVRMRRNVRM